MPWGLRITFFDFKSRNYGQKPHLNAPFNHDVDVGIISILKTVQVKYLAMISSQKLQTPRAMVFSAAQLIEMATQTYVIKAPWIQILHA